MTPLPWNFTFKFIKLLRNPEILLLGLKSSSAALGFHFSLF